MATVESVPSLIDSFLLSRRIENCTKETLRTYEQVLSRFAQTGESAIAYLNRRRSEVQGITLHKDYRTLRAFFKWAVDAGMVESSPLAGIKMRLPKTLPRMPEDTDVAALLGACKQDWSGRRNAVVVALLADSALRRSEVCRLLLEDVSLAQRTLHVLGKGQKERTGHFGARTAQLIRAWLTIRIRPNPEDPLICSRAGRAVSKDYITHLLYRLCRQAQLTQLWSPHSLRHYAATRILKTTGNLELVRQVLGHETLTMTLRYARLTGMDVGQRFRKASPLDSLDW